MTNNIKKSKDWFSTLIPVLLIASVALSCVAYIYDFSLEASTYKTLKDIFFVPLKKWTFVVIAAAMFSVFFRSIWTYFWARS